MNEHKSTRHKLIRRNAQKIEIVTQFRLMINCNSQQSERFTCMYPNKTNVTNMTRNKSVVKCFWASNTKLKLGLTVFNNRSEKTMQMFTKHAADLITALSKC